ncbi:hypothetical protein ACFO4O_04410 [Glaciecola siphonariae]|uniref:Uncharacterized protein n=1 Tax=Glaciecola siphonariae TaxID=521012 RepID=A0ABV9LSB7_9ALTE
MSVKEFIRFDGVDDRIDFPAYTMPTSGVWFVEFSFVPSDLQKRYESMLYLNLNTLRISSNYDFAGDKGYISFSARSTSPVDENVNMNSFNLPSIQAGKLCSARLEFNLDTGVMSLTVDGVFATSETFDRPEDLRGLEFPVGKADFGRGFNISDRFFASDLKHININNQHVYDANDSRNTDTLLFDSVGGQHATLVNEPTYVDYQDAWYLEATSNNQYISISNGVDILTDVGDYLELTIQPNADADILLTGVDTNSFVVSFPANNSSRLLVRANGTANTINNSVSADDILITIRLEKKSSTVLSVSSTELQMSQDVTFADLSSLKLNRIFNVSFGYTGKFYKLVNYNQGAIQNRYNPTLSNGTGLILEDEIGGNDGTLVNFPTDNSQWVYSPVEVPDTPSTPTSSGLTATVGGAISSVLRPAISSVIQNAIGGSVSAVAQAVRRYFTSFNQNAQSHITLSSPIELDGDFEIEVLIYTPNVIDAQMVLGNSGGTNNCIFIANGDVHSRDTTGSTLVTSSPEILPNKLTKIKAVKTNGNIEVFINDTSGASGSFGSLILNRVGIRQATFFPFKGIIADLKIWKGGDRNTGMLVLDMPIDKQYENLGLVENKSAVLTTVPTNFFSSTSQSTSLAISGTANSISISADGTENYPRVAYDGVLEAGKTYLITATVDLRQTGNRVFFTGSKPSTQDLRFKFHNVGTIETKTEIIRANQTELLVFIDENIADTEPNTAALVTNVSIKEIPALTPIGTFNNITLADSQEYTQDSDGNWLGTTNYWDEDNVVSQGLETEKDVPIKGTYRIKTPDSDISLVEVPNGMPDMNSSYKFEVTIIENNGGSFSVSDTISGVAENGFTGKFEKVFIPAFYPTIKLKRQAPPVDIQFKGVSVRDYLEVN